METARPRGTDNAKVIKVICTESIIGRGIEEDPVRLIYQYWDFKGNLLAENDTLKEIVPVKQTDTIYIKEPVVTAGLVEVLNQSKNQ